MDSEDEKLTWIPAFVVFEGEKYKAPLSLREYFTYKTLMEILREEH